MSFKKAAVLAPVCFFLGVLFVCFTVDQRILYGAITEETIEDGFQFYTTFFNAPPAIKATIHGLVGVGLIGLVAKLHNWDESSTIFDGSSLCGYVFAISVYLTVIIPALRTIVTPVENVDTKEDRIEAMRLLAAGNIIIILLLGLVLVLQGGQEYARRVMTKEAAVTEDMPATNDKTKQ